VERKSGDANIRWSVVSLDDGHSLGGTAEPHGGAPRGVSRNVEPKLTEPDSAKAALDRIVIPQDSLDRITEIGPRSSLIVTDEAVSSETGKGTDFVVLLSGEPQGGIKFRRRAPANEFGYARPRGLTPYWRAPFAGPSW